MRMGGDNEAPVAQQKACSAESLVKEARTCKCESTEEARLMKGQTGFRLTPKISIFALYVLPNHLPR